MSDGRDAKNSCRCESLPDERRDSTESTGDPWALGYGVERIAWYADGMELQFSEPISPQERLGAYGVSILRDLETPVSVRGVSQAESHDLLQLQAPGVGREKQVDVSLEMAPLSSTGKTLAVSRWRCSVASTAPLRTLPRMRAAPSPSLNGLTEDERREGWHSLFDGHSLKGWLPLKSSALSPYWRVEQGAIHLLGLDERATAWDSADILRTVASYAEFDLRLEWRIAFGGNSGVFYLLRPPAPDGHTTGLEYQLLDDRYSAEGQVRKHRAGDLYDVATGRFNVARYPGEWNSTRVLVRNGRVQHWLNGRLLLTQDLTGPQWTAAVAASKFAGDAAYGAILRGFIGLQDHESSVWFRNIRIRELAAP